MLISRTNDLDARAGTFLLQPIHVYSNNTLIDISAQKEGARHGPESIERMEASTVCFGWLDFFCL
jgi:hypothetical protein